MMDDGGLLRKYGETGSEECFSELVGRYLPIVYSTALRHVSGNEAMAKDITQTVFIDLARKASMLASRKLIGGWIYTSTCYAARKAWRTEMRRKRRESL